jgi:molecular chaperone DnaK
MATGKEQSIRIQASSGLSEEEINKMQKDAELHAEEDRKRKELAEARNQADNLVYTTEKSMQELGDKVDQATKDQISEKIAVVKKAIEGDDPEAIKKAQDELMQASHKLAEMMYQQQAGGTGGGDAGGATGGGAASGAAGGAAGAGAAGGGATRSGGDDDVVDADFEDVK